MASLHVSNERKPMTPLRYIFGFIWVLFIWIMVACVVGFGVPEFLRIPQVFRSYAIVICLFLGIIIGFFAARQSWLTHVRLPTDATPPKSSATISKNYSHGLALFALLWSLPSGLSALAFRDFLQRGSGWGALCGALVFPGIHLFIIAAAIHYWGTERQQRVTTNPQLPRS